MTTLDPFAQPHIRRNTTLRLFADISVTGGTENPTNCAIVTMSSRSRSQRGCEASRTIGVRTFVTCAAFTHEATLSRASGSGSGGWKARLGRFLAK